MITSAQKLLQAAAGQAGGEALAIEDVFSTYLYTGNNTTQTIDNGIDLNGEGGLMWVKARNNAYDNMLFDTERGVGKYLFSNLTNPEGDFGGSFGLYANTSGTGFIVNGSGNGYNDADTPTNYASWTFRKAPRFFDVVAYTGAGTIQTINHNLGVKPEAILFKQRSGTTGWIWWYDAFGDNQTFIRGDLTNATFTNTTYFNNTAPTDTQITLGFHGNVSGTTSTNYIAYLFATLAGVSKVGSYTGNGTSQTIDCGFTSGARFILIKRTDSTGDWYVWDTARGIVAANDPHLSLNTTAAEVTTDDSVDPDSSGFIVNQVAATNINVSSANYIFYAVS